MPSVVEFNFVDSKSGKITYTPPSSYVAATSWSNCQTGQDASLGIKWRAYFNFNTASLPDTALISKVEFLIRKNIAQPGGDPDVYYLKFSIGTFIGAMLDGTPAEFGGGTLMVTLTTPPLDNTWLDLNQDAHRPDLYVNRLGDTDIKVWDDSIQGGGDSYWGLNFNTSKGKCKLRITYTVPSGTATGRGYATCAGTAAAVGGAAATGRGFAEAAASVWSAGSATASGRGHAELTGTVIVAGSGTATGRGTVVIDAVVSALGSAQATGLGAAQLVAGVMVAGVAAATGRGAVEITATVTAFASSTATGHGAAECDAWVQEPSASATATGRGFAWCRLTEVHFDPLARHFGSRAVRAGSTGIRAVSPVHSATRACTWEDDRLRGARRLN